MADETVEAKRKKILVVDDDPDCLEVLGTMLESSGFDALGVNSNANAFTLLRDHPELFDLLVTDYETREVTGIELAMLVNMMRHAQGKHSLPMVLMSAGNHLGEDVVSDAGFSASLKKPFSLRELRDAVTLALKEGGNDQTNA
ncbi:MAG: response regulator [Syntrophobacteraceae bacterium]|jgi:CheY-like chemotaxis protein